jgi:hypothetical protein
MRKNSIAFIASLLLSLAIIGCASSPVVAVWEASPASEPALSPAIELAEPTSAELKATLGAYQASAKAREKELAAQLGQVFLAAGEELEGDFRLAKSSAGERFLSCLAAVKGEQERQIEQLRVKALALDLAAAQADHQQRLAVLQVRFEEEMKNLEERHQQRLAALQVELCLALAEARTQVLAETEVERAEWEAAIAERERKLNPHAGILPYVSCSAATGSNQ